MKKFYFLLLILSQLCFNSYAQWVQTNGPQGVNVKYLALEDSVLFAGTNNGLFRSTNNGINWNLLNSGGDSNIQFLVVSDSDIFVGSYNSSFPQVGWIRYSNNQGITWASLPDKNWSSAVWYFAKIDTSLFVSGYSGLYRSTDHGARWNLANSGLDKWEVIMCFASINNYILAGSEYGGIYNSNNGGISWLKDTTGIPRESGHFATIKNLLVKDTSVFATSDVGILISNDNGITWETRNVGLLDSNITALTTNGIALFAGTKSDGIYISMNNGATWNSVNEGLIDKGIYSLAVSNSYIYAGTLSGVWRRPISEMITGIESKQNILPLHFYLSQNYPNPFNPTTTIKYSIPKTSYVTVKVYDIIGREIRTLVNNQKSTGNHEIVFNASELSSGIYFYKMQAGNFIKTKKLILLK